MVRLFFILLSFGIILLLPQRVEAVNYPNDWLNAIARVTSTAKTVEDTYGKDTLSHCSCRVKYMDDVSFFTGKTSSFAEAPDKIKYAALYFFQNTDQKLFHKSVGIGADYRVFAHVNFEQNVCDLEIRDSGNNLTGYFEKIECEIKKRTNCCCSKEEGEYSTKYFNCQQTSLTLDNVNANCQAVLPFDDTANSCPAEHVVQTGSAPKGQSNLIISADTLKERTKTLNMLGITSVNQLIERAIGLLMAFMGTILFALYVYAGFLWMTAAGSEEKITSAKNILIWSTLGVAVMMSSYVIVKFIFESLKV